MVPMDQPESAHDMVNRFVNNAWNWKSKVDVSEFKWGCFDFLLKFVIN